MELSELGHQLDEEVEAKCAGDLNLQGPEDGFTEVMLGYLSEGSEVDSWELDYAKKQGTRKSPAYKINAWNLHTQNSDGDSAPLVDLFVSVYKAGGSGQSVANSEVAEHFALARSFLDQALNAFGNKLSQMEESAPPFEAAQAIWSHRDNLDSARIFLLTNGVVKQSNEKDTIVRGVEVKHYLWDLEKLRRLLSSGKARETIEVDLLNQYGESVPCLAHDDGTGEYTAYLAFFPASLLSRIYGDFGPRLLEKNVRSFLQARGKVNKGIQSTLRDSPHRFLAYNNGISATAESVTISTTGGINRIEVLRDFQIVNGGQTTASIYHAVKKDGVDVANVAVQVKLTVVRQSEKLADFVPLISRFANSQNKVNVADFSANDAWHQKLEELSRTIWAPSISGTGKGTHWYYERARGSHLDDKVRSGPPAKRKTWEAENPVSQKFTKTDVAKYEHTWDQRPFLVSRGAEKNFVEWTLNRQKASSQLPDKPSFEALCAKAILFTTAERLIGSLKLGGYKANVVTYTLSWLSKSSNQRIDLGKIWQKQQVGKVIQEAIVTIGPIAYEFLVSFAAGRNVTEVAKKIECWEAFTKVRIDIPSLASEFASSRVAEDEPTFAGGARASAVEIIDKVKRLNHEVWDQLLEWAKSGNLERWQITMCMMLATKLRKGTRLKLDESKGLLDILETARNKGFEG